MPKSMTRNGATSQIKRARRNSSGFLPSAPRLAWCGLATARTCFGRVSGTMKTATRDAASAMAAESRKGLVKPRV